jgi:hypothetical protein
VLDEVDAETGDVAEGEADASKDSDDDDDDDRTK